jgi:hypothetical protein
MAGCFLPSRGMRAPVRGGAEAETKLGAGEAARTWQVGVIGRLATDSPGGVNWHRQRRFHDRFLRRVRRDDEIAGKRSRLRRGLRSGRGEAGNRIDRRCTLTRDCIRVYLRSSAAKDSFFARHAHLCAGAGAAGWLNPRQNAQADPNAMPTSAPD